MVVVYRKKTRSNEVVNPEMFKPGLVVWAQIPGIPERQPYVCDEQLILVPLDMHQARNRERADKNRSENIARFMANQSAGKHDTSHLGGRRNYA